MDFFWPFFHVAKISKNDHLERYASCDLNISQNLISSHNCWYGMWKMWWWTPLSMGGPCCLIDSQDSIGIWPRLAFSYALSTQDFQSTVICNFWVVLGVKICEFDSTISSWPKSMLVLWWQWFRMGRPAHTTRSNVCHRTWLQMICNVPLFGFISHSWIMSCAIISPNLFKFLVKKFLL